MARASLIGRHQRIDVLRFYEDIFPNDHQFIVVQVCEQRLSDIYLDEETIVRGGVSASVP